MTGRPASIRVLVVEDSAMFAGELVRMLASDPRITVAGVASNGLQARGEVRRLRPDVVTLDVHMPRMDGLTCLQYIMAENPTPCLMVSTMTGAGALESFEAMELGAVDVIEKPRDDSDRSKELFRRRLIAKVVVAHSAEVRNLTPLAPRAPTPRQRALRRDEDPSPEQMVVIGASTGGPRTVLEILSELPQSFAAPVVVVQHMPASFTRQFAQRLDNSCDVAVKEAEFGDVLRPGAVYVARGDMHLYIEQAPSGQGCSLRLSKEPRNVFSTPSVGVTIDSALAAYGKQLIAVMLTGIGDDGADSMLRAYTAGATTIAESEETAVVYGMPRAVIQRNAARFVLPRQAIGQAIVREVAGRRRP